jgi:UDP-GlcNAc:undecaprenyl-phosphate/decaprenyl-phosphate GlcNAc-1-phosphate transferase
MRDFFLDNKLTLLYIIFSLGMILFSVLINGIFVRFSKTLGIRNVNENGIRWSSESKPAFGGISFYIIFLLTIVTYSILFNKDNVFFDLNFLGLLIAVTLGFLIGLADDAYDTRPWLKFSVQVICGLVLILTGSVIDITNNTMFNYFFTLLWVVGIMNAINLLDNMDAIATLTSIFTVLGALIVLTAHQNGNNIYTLILVGLLASLIGFLFFNWSPAKMYMGDTGSQFLGVLLGAIGINYFWNIPVQPEEPFVSKKIIMVAMAFMIPIIDTTTVIINRISKGHSPFIGGKDHTTHHVSYLGFSEKAVAKIMALISLTGLLIITAMVFLIDTWSSLYFITFGIYFLLVFVVLFYITRIKRKKTA